MFSSLLLPVTRYVFLMGLQDCNEKLFYRVITSDIERFMPIIYTPTVGLACQQYGLIFRKPRWDTLTSHNLEPYMKICFSLFAVNRQSAKIKCIILFSLTIPTNQSIFQHSVIKCFIVLAVLLFLLLNLLSAFVFFYDCLFGNSISLLQAAFSHIECSGKNWLIAGFHQSQPAGSFIIFVSWRNTNKCEFSSEVNKEPLV